ncbi:cytidine/deoxycytidylate deaminase family protein [Patescibacteria group bacterium]|nr:cytidine/deoxycytidylate deaminase family protein [Patescibacteria group bacterium]MBU1448455.1 cytidine/deoxycytidylate deaminase family protein [Patescibacteria group bacterium]MBU2613285.1 cytidine/deoxycytidylate deaminase family protein [Patescibacteria group bacterium]
MNESIPNPRPSWDEYFLEIARVVGRRGTCDRGMIGVVIVRDKRILATGYVGSPVGLLHCDEVGHQMKKVTHEDGNVSQHCMRTSHAELNAICNAARYGIAIDGATFYGKFEPCHTCAKALINAGVKRVVCEKQYHAATDTRKLFEQAGIELVVVTPVVEEYPNQ